MDTVPGQVGSSGEVDGTASRRLVVAVHDVAPSSAAEVRWLLDALDRLGARPRSLLVIPAEPGSRLDGEPALAAMLRDGVAAGDEIVLHGFSHRSAGPFLGPWPARLRGRLFAPQAAEFLALRPSAMRERLVQGRATLGRLGLDAEGFCAPGWLAAPGLAGCLRELGFRFLAGFASVTDLGSGRRLVAPAGGYMGAPRDEGLVRAETALARALAGDRPLQLFLHPQGASRSRDCARVLRLLERELRSRQPTTYRGLLDGRA